MRTHLSPVAAAILLGLEGVGIAVLAAWQVAALVQGDTESLASAVALLVLSIIGAAAVIGFAIAVARDRSWGRSGGVVTQLLILAVALGAVTGTPPYLLFALGLAAPAIITLMLLVVASRKAGAGRGEG